ncbi:MAG TPA: GGDEF domain-containing protein [Aquabacterium sp.]|uniref:GGDEF domain-containing protein n=1 Tax=Aquabacterium sp. TaxID=1872578 RepID=UPI002DADAC10|nr:GGDEF domain-containing protein [Aquabacterium sp.]HET6786669.1 GGDEF domain-containing protein [Aquabacterium sp.]HEX5372601.1 GGDEF domain-containing protein [Aquabacterium sp.]
MSTIAPEQDFRTSLVAADWRDLLTTIKARLKMTVDALPLVAPPEAPVALQAQLQRNVLTCIDALEQVQILLASELKHHRELEKQAHQAELALATMRRQLSGLQAGERQARHQARHDGLTHLPNRSFFRERLEGSLMTLSGQQPVLAVFFLDLDAFKQVNDTHGHAVGDALLAIVAERLTRAVRAHDMVSRLGGDEFACLLVGVPGREQLCRLARKLVEVVSAPVKIGEVQLSVHPSIGIAMCPDDGASADDLLHHADQAMYRAKRHQTGFAFVGA